MRATEPSLPRSTPSYSRWAVCMVRSPREVQADVGLLLQRAGRERRRRPSRCGPSARPWRRRSAPCPGRERWPSPSPGRQPRTSCRPTRPARPGTCPRRISACGGLAAVLGFCPPARGSPSAAAAPLVFGRQHLDKGFGASATVPVGASRAVIFQYSVGLNASISRSRSTTRRSATDCTRPALERGATFLLSRLLSG